ncbi:hypothetical protein FVE85_4367 [Porphyridium purpureum]|uniref:Uncharacterized protein n=1 Tax=Porphyridium purpureum TaxID=35688 RepID=A0A5J4YGU8_PORPP|nr:hypothetical protein FVE85_4367 [Porphyridium purpureum]|eukprot:POR2926..scf270_19
MGCAAVGAVDAIMAQPVADGYSDEVYRRQALTGKIVKPSPSPPQQRAGKVRRARGAEKRQRVDARLEHAAGAQEGDVISAHGTRAQQEELVRYLSTAQSFVGFEFNAQMFVLTVNRRLPAGGQCAFNADSFQRVLDELPSDDDDEIAACGGNAMRTGSSSRQSRPCSPAATSSLPPWRHTAEPQAPGALLEEDPTVCCAVQELFNFED